MRYPAAKKSANNRSTFKKGRRGSLLRRDFFSFVAQKPRKSTLFWYFFRGIQRGGFLSSTCGRDVTLFPRHDACNNNNNNNTTHTHLRERRENVIKDDSPSDVVEARHRVKRRTVRRASGEFFVGVVRVNVIRNQSSSSFFRGDILVFEKQREQRGERGEERDGKRQSIAKRDRGRA